MALAAPRASLHAPARSTPGGLRRVKCAAGPEGKQQGPPAKPAFQRSAAQEQLAAIDKAVTDAQAAMGESLLNALGPLRDALGLRRRTNTPRINAGQLPKWTAAAAVLNAAKLRSVTPAQAQELMQRGARGKAAWFPQLPTTLDISCHTQAGCCLTCRLRTTTSTSTRPAA